jgi:hypothetical protein
MRERERKERRMKRGEGENVTNGTIAIEAAKAISQAVKSLRQSASQTGCKARSSIFDFWKKCAIDF